MPSWCCFCVRLASFPPTCGLVPDAAAGDTMNGPVTRRDLERFLRSDRRSRDRPAVRRRQARLPGRRSCSGGSTRSAVAGAAYLSRPWSASPWPRGVRRARPGADGRRDLFLSQQRAVSTRWRTSPCPSACESTQSSARTLPRSLRLLSAAYCASGEEALLHSDRRARGLSGVDPSWRRLDQGGRHQPRRSRKGRAARAIPPGRCAETAGQERQEVVPRGRPRLPARRRRARRRGFRSAQPGERRPDLWPPATYDVVFCRNVLMYFAPDQARAAIERIARSLAPGGYPVPRPRRDPAGPVGRLPPAPQSRRLLLPAQDRRAGLVRPGAAPGAAPGSTAALRAACSAGRGVGRCDPRGQRAGPGADAGSEGAARQTPVAPAGAI